MHVRKFYGKRRDKFSKNGMNSQFPDHLSDDLSEFIGLLIGKRTQQPGLASLPTFVDLGPDLLPLPGKTKRDGSPVCLINVSVQISVNNQFFYYPADSGRG